MNSRVNLLISQSFQRRDHLLKIRRSEACEDTLVITYKYIS